MPKRRANGEGNIRKRKDGRWEGRYTVGHDPETGKAIIKNVLWGDRIFEKCGIRRDEGGDDGKTLETRGKRRLSARDGGANYQQS